VDNISLRILLSAFLVALLHTAIPSHWLCFVLIGRDRGWSLRRTMALAAATGTLHVLTTVSLGLLFATAGKWLVEPEELERISGWILLGLGALYLFLQFTHRGHHHEKESSGSDRVALAALVFAVTISPCSLAIPILVTAAATSVMQVALITIVLLATTVGNMVLLVGLTGLGIEKLPFSFFDRYEKLVLGVVLALVGGFLLFAHGH
jgi:putative Mn2+ efflux pump MntP